MEFSQCSCSGRTLGRLVQPAIMAVLAEESLHGYLLVQRLSTMEMFRSQPPDPTGVYRMLRSMEKDGLVSSAWDLGDSGPAKRRLALTECGRACLREWSLTLEEYGRAIGDLLAIVKRQRGKVPGQYDGGQGRAVALRVKGERVR